MPSLKGLFMLKSLLFTSLVCLALGGGALSSPYPNDVSSTYEILAFGDDPKLLPIGNINGLHFGVGSSFYNGRIVSFNNDAPVVNSGIVLADHPAGNTPPIRVAMYITTIPFYNSVMVEESLNNTVFQNTHSEVLFLHLVFSSTSTYNSTALISIPLGFRDSDLNHKPVNWWENGLDGPGDDYYQVFFKAKQLTYFDLWFSYNFNTSILNIHSNLFYQEAGTGYFHGTINAIDLTSNDFVKFFGNAGGRAYRNVEWDNTMLEMSMLELTNFSLYRFPIFSVNPSFSYESAYQEGYDAGLNQNINNGGLFSVFISMFAGLSSFLAISLFPGVTIGGIALIFLVIPLTYGIIKLMRGGGG